MGTPRWPPCAPRPVQLRDPSLLTSEAYVAESAWQKASLTHCPRHSRGGCGFARHGTYRRVTPAGMRITRYYCPTAHETFSLLPDCLASRFPGDLDDLERVVAQVEAAPSIEAAADVLCPDSVLPSAVRWVRRRLTLVRATCLAVVTLLPDSVSRRRAAGGRPRGAGNGPCPGPAAGACRDGAAGPAASTRIRPSRAGAVRAAATAPTPAGG